MQLFEVKVKYDKMGDNGVIKRSSELYVVDAISFTEAEERIIKEVEPFISGEFEVDNIKKIRVVELIESNDANADKWYKARVGYITIDEKTEKEKVTVQLMLVQGASLPEALAELQKALDKGLGDCIIKSITETQILDVYRHEA